MGGGVDVRVHAQCNTGLEATPGRQGIDQRELGFGFAVETFDLVFERVVDLLRGLADAGKNDGRRVCASLQRAKQLAAGDDVEARARLDQQLQDRKVAVSLDGVTNFVRN